MITTEQLKNKKEFYQAKLNELITKDVDVEINKRLNAMREKVQKEVCEEIEADVKKCNHYLDVIDELLTEDKEETNEEPISESIEPSTEEYINIESYVDNTNEEVNYVN